MTCTALLQWWQHVVCDHEALPGVLMLAAGTFVAIIVVIMQNPVSIMTFVNDCK